MIKKEYLFEVDKIMQNKVVFHKKDTNHYCEFMVLEEDMFRVLIYKDSLAVDKTWTVAPDMADIPREGRDRMDISVFTCPEFECLSDDGVVTISTSKLKALVSLNGLITKWYKYQGNEWVEFASDRPTQAYNFENELGTGIYHYMTRKRDDMYFGLGERSGETNRHGNRFIMKNVDAMGYNARTSDPLYKHIPFYIVRNNEVKIPYGVFYDNFSTSVFDMGREYDNYHGLFRYYHAELGDIDYYMFVGDTVGELTKKFSRLTGKTVFPPKWSIGYSGSSMKYTDAPDAQEQLKEFVENCEKHDIICDSFHLSSGYTSIKDKRYVFNWNRSKFPDPKEFAKYFYDRGIRLCANIKPTLLVDHPKFEELEERGLFIKDSHGNKAELAMFWDDLGASIDFTNPEAFDWWKEQVTKQLLEYGIVSTWNDNNEYEILDSNAKAYGNGKAINIGHIRPIQSLLMMKASYEAQTEYASNERPYLISRSGCPGMQRYVQTWSGDNYTSWETIKYNVKMGIGLSLSGVYNIGHDVGGFSGNAPDPEQFVRWVQQGIFWPRFSIHSWNDDKTVNEAWMYPEVLDVIRKLIKFRTKITPYIYNQLYRAHAYYEPMVKPTFYNYEFDEKTFEENDEFMLGDDILVASVVEPNVYQRDVYLPKDENGWYDYNTSRWYAGGQTVTIPAPLDSVPILIRGGSIIPMNTANVTAMNKDLDERTFYIYPPKGVGTFSRRFFEDDGHTNNYIKGQYAVINVEVKASDDEIVVNYLVEGDYELPYEKFDFQLPLSETRQVIINKLS